MATPVVAVATSGGRDSTALLHATARSAAALGLRVAALHVHHGLNPHADDWLDHVRRQCARWQRAGLPVEFDARRLQAGPAAGQSIEAWARRARYQALAEMAHEAGAGCVLLAHHRRDQAETVLLQLLRGGGPAGLAAMPREAERDGLLWLRPWLAQPGEAIVAYVRRWRLRHIEDDSNSDTRFARNRLRHELWPALLGAFPDAEHTLSQAARQAALAAELIDEIAAQDLPQVCEAAAGQPADTPAPLAVARWLLLSPARRTGVLRAWLRPVLLEGVPDSLLTRLADELPASRTARWPLQPGLELRLYRGLLRCGAVRPAAEPAAPAEAPPMPLDLSRPGRYPLPAWHGVLEVQAVAQGGLACSALRGASLRTRQGGERFQAAPRSTPRSLKKQYQAAAVPSWQREGPLVWRGEELLFVPGLGLDARRLAPAGTPQCRLAWWPGVAA